MKIIKVGEISTVVLYVIWECEEFKGKLASYELSFSKMTIQSQMSACLSW